MTNKEINELNDLLSRNELTPKQRKKQNELLDKFEEEIQEESYKKWINSQKALI